MAHRAALHLKLQPYGTTVSGLPLEYLPGSEPCRLLLVAGIHGEESDGVISLSRAFRSIDVSAISRGIAAVFCANPDGVLRGTRGNARGVDLNRNFPAANWSPAPSSCRWHFDEDETLPIASGSGPASEPETAALIALIEEIRPQGILALHGPLACVDDPGQSATGRWIAEQTGLPLVTDIGYPTPGSMGTWAMEKNIPLITWEFPPGGIESLSRSQVPVLAKIISGNFPQ